MVAALVLPLVVGRLDAADRGSACFSPLWSVRGDGGIALSTDSRNTPRPVCCASCGPIAAPYYGMLLAHVGVGVFIVGVTLVKGYETETDVRLDVGSIDHGGRRRRSSSTASRAGLGPNYRAVTASSSK